MGKNTVCKILQIEGMTCTGCETILENALNKLDGVINAKAIYSSSNVYVTYRCDIIGINKIIKAVEKLDYRVKNKPDTGQDSKDKNKAAASGSDSFGISQFLGIAVSLLALYIIIKNTIGFNFIPQIDQSMGFGILFIIGLLTSLHCVAMCGGINLSVCTKYRTDTGDSSFSKLRPGILYNTGRVISYTAVGGIVGGIGSIVSFSGTAKGIVAIAAGAFMLIMGLNMLNIFPVLRKITPRMPKLFAKRVHASNNSRGPFYVGLLNGLMPCGPLQAMQIYALGTGSVLAGALSMFLFSLGTVPLMLGLGVASSFLSSKFTHKMMKVSAVLVMILGIVMLNRGLALSGVSINPVAANSASSSGIAAITGNVQTVNTTLDSGRYYPITVQKGIPVRWTISVADGDLNGCNRSLRISEYNIENKNLEVGDNVIEFTPDKTGNFIYTCWMGMLRSNIIVVDDISTVNPDGIENELNNYQQPAAGCCGG
ncbi:sulfite exporter TauE/SafE [Ruminiclostridium sufflavum DSM 19573]|uniref:Sulfite exporter TauE/SafE n=1 Tax=Ruminiclostridium sufflavum DSM 19573 TaxID=1121337 RepID=A0A318XFS1_9FIRM|nr:sulfite exporter TauE/SafE family protein [Ruminiclostridium sufflavum]PYG84307.1 sulfite exporter TauE/SafE [Ruminiclostridium sufflavum DSM 19573]